MKEMESKKVSTWRDVVGTISSPYNTYVFISMRNSGKSKSIRNLIVELLEKIPHHNIILFSTTAYNNLNDDYKFLVDSPFAKVFPGDKKEIDSHIDEILNHCKAMKKKKKDYSIMVIFDDIDVTKKNDKVAELFTQGRHYNLSVIVSSQNAAYFLDPTKRSNIDYLGFRKVENTYKKTLWNMCNTKMKFEEFKDFINENTTDYKFILYDNTSQTKDDKERFKIVKAVLYDEMKVRKSK